MSLDWTNVQIGKTVLVDKVGQLFLVAAMHRSEAWLYCESDGYFLSRSMQTLSDNGWTIREEVPESRDVTGDAEILSNGKLRINTVVGTTFDYGLPSGRSWHKTNAVVLPEDWRTFSFNQLQVLLLNEQQSVLCIKKEGGG